MIPPTDANLNKLSLEYSYDEICRATNSFSPSKNRLGKGTYGSVYKGCLRDGTEVAIKVLTAPKESGFREEVEVLSKFRHPQLVILMGFARGPGKERCLIYELLEQDLCGRLAAQQDHGLPGQQGSKGQGPLGYMERLTILLDSALGLSHLHCATPQVFHRDIKSQNILLDRRGCAKMADFGLALLAEQSASNSNNSSSVNNNSNRNGNRGGIKVEHTSGTIGYADPLYINTSVVTEKSEVYSFGMVVLEILTSKPPALQMPDGRIEYQFTKLMRDPNQIWSMLDQKGQWPQFLVLELCSFALKCVHQRESERPVFIEIVKTIRHLIQRCKAVEGGNNTNNINANSKGIKNDNANSIIANHQIAASAEAAANQAREDLEKAKQLQRVAQENQRNLEIERKAQEQAVQLQMDELRRKEAELARKDQEAQERLARMAEKERQMQWQEQNQKQFLIAQQEELQRRQYEVQQQQQKQERQIQEQEFEMSIRQQQQALQWEQLQARRESDAKNAAAAAAASKSATTAGLGFNLNNSDSSKLSQQEIEKLERAHRQAMELSAQQSSYTKSIAPGIMLVDSQSDSKKVNSNNTISTRTDSQIFPSSQQSQGLSSGSKSGGATNNVPGFSGPQSVSLDNTVRRGDNVNIILNNNSINAQGTQGQSSSSGRGFQPSPFAVPYANSAFSKGGGKSQSSSKGQNINNNIWSHTMTSGSGESVIPFPGLTSITTGSGSGQHTPQIDSNNSSTVTSSMKGEMISSYSVLKDPNLQKNYQKIIQQGNSNPTSVNSSVSHPTHPDSGLLHPMPPSNNPFYQRSEKRKSETPQTNLSQQSSTNSKSNFSQKDKESSQSKNRRGSSTPADGRSPISENDYKNQLKNVINPNDDIKKDLNALDLAKISNSNTGPSTNSDSGPGLVKESGSGAASSSGSVHNIINMSQNSIFDNSRPVSSEIQQGQQQGQGSNINSNPVNKNNSITNSQSLSLSTSTASATQKISPGKLNQAAVLAIGSSRDLFPQPKAQGQQTSKAISNSQGLQAQVVKSSSPLNDDHQSSQTQSTMSKSDDSVKCRQNPQIISGSGGGGNSNTNSKSNSSNNNSGTKLTNVNDPNSNVVINTELPNSDIHDVQNDSESFAPVSAEEKRAIIYEKHSEDIFKLMDMGFTSEQSLWAFFQTDSVDDAINLIVEADPVKTDFSSIPVKKKEEIQQYIGEEKKDEIW